MGRLVHVSVAVETVEDWMVLASGSFGFPSSEVTRHPSLGRPALRAERDLPYRTHPGGEPELEDFMQALEGTQRPVAR